MMLRMLPIAVALIAFQSSNTRPAQATEGPWCAFISIGTGTVYEDCQYYAFAACQPNVLAGNRGFCNVNPRWVGPPPRYVRSGRAYRY
jgi:Protein of unknown function (DUF3551)